MKKLFLVSAMLTLLFGACNKKDNGSNGTGSNEFKIGSTTYKDVYLTRLLGLEAISPTGGSMIFRFHNNTLPGSSQTLKVVEDANASDEVEIAASFTSNGVSKTFVAGHVSGQTVKLSLTDGLYKIEFSNISARNPLDNSETTSLSANVFEEP